MTQSVVQSAVQGSNAVGTVTATFGHGTTAGSTVCAILVQTISTAGGIPVIAPTGPAGFTTITAANYYGGYALISAWYKDNVTPGTTAVSISSSQNSSTDKTLYIIEMAGLATPSLGNFRMGPTQSTFQLWFAGENEVPQPHGIAFGAMGTYQNLTNNDSPDVGAGHGPNGSTEASYAISTTWNTTSNPIAVGGSLGPGSAPYGFTGICIYFLEAAAASKTINPSGTGTVVVNHQHRFIKTIKAVAGGIIQAVRAHVLHAVQVVSATSIGDTAIHIVTAPTGAGHTLVVGITAYDPGLVAINPPAGGWLDSGQGFHSLDSLHKSQLFYLTNCPPGLTNFTFTLNPPSSSMAYSAEFIEISGVDPLHLPPDISIGATGSSQIPATGTSGLTPFPAEMIISYLGAGGSNVLTGDGSYTNHLGDASPYVESVLGYKTTTAQATQHATGAIATGDEAWASYLLAFRGFALPAGHFVTILANAAHTLQFRALKPPVIAILAAIAGVLNLETIKVTNFQHVTVAGTHVLAFAKLLQMFIRIAGLEGTRVIRRFPMTLAVLGTAIPRVARTLSRFFAIASSGTARVAQAIAIAMGVLGHFSLVLTRARAHFLVVASGGIVRETWRLGKTLKAVGTGLPGVLVARMRTLHVSEGGVILALIFTRVRNMKILGTGVAHVNPLRAIIMAIFGSQTLALKAARVLVMLMKAQNTGHKISRVRKFFRKVHVSTGHIP